MAAVLPREFFARDALALARALLGKLVVHRSDQGVAAGRIVEVEAYRGPGDRAAHTYGGRRTPRNEAMWGPPGFAYVYFVYGMHWCMNVVGAADGVPEAVLLRALEPVEGVELMRARRGGRGKDEHLLRGPANLCKALGVSGERNGADLCRGALTLRDAAAVPARRVRRTPRIGVGYAGADAELPWRLFVADSAAVSGPAALRAAR